jgi:hypothetical protein
MTTCLPGTCETLGSIPSTAQQTLKQNNSPKPALKATWTPLLVDWAFPWVTQLGQFPGNPHHQCLWVSSLGWWDFLCMGGEHVHMATSKGRRREPQWLGRQLWLMSDLQHGPSAFRGTGSFASVTVFPSPEDKLLSAGEEHCSLAASCQRGLALLGLPPLLASDLGVTC